MSNFSALHVALSGLRAAQLRMDTASNNVSNANTPGYTRQRVDLQTAYPRLTINGQVGQGVEVQDITRLRDVMMDARYRSSLAASSALDVRADLLSRAEMMSGEPDQGITKALGSLWDAFEDLSLDPTNHGARVSVLQQLNEVTGQIGRVAVGLSGLAGEASSNITHSLEEVNLTLKRVADLNQAIIEESVVSGSPNRLADQRDQLIDRLAELAGVGTRIEDDGTVAVMLGGISLVDGNRSTSLTYDDTTHQVLHPSGIAIVPGGEMGGYLQAVTKDFPGLEAELDAFAVTFTDALNTIHQAGFTAAGPGGPVLAYDPAGPAATLSVAISDPADIATAATAGPPFPTFDAFVPEQLAGLRTALVAGGGTTTIGEVARGFVTRLGHETAAARTGADTQARLVETAGLSRDAMHGVSLDEEMVNLMEGQRMYEAAARVITAVDEALDVLINRTGLVGR